MSQAATKVKVCGITNLADGELAVELGAWALGMIFYERSPRRCSQAQAQELAAALRRRVQLCGVYVNAPLERIAADADELELNLVQLHGDEGPSFCAEVARRTGARVIKAAQVSAVGDVRDLERFHVDYHLLDARAKPSQAAALRGGTGETFDWSLIAARRSRVPLILSGGLDGENVAEAIATAHPFAVDSASGTEAAPGHKDPRKLRALFDAVAATQPDAQLAAPPPEEPAPGSQPPAGVGQPA
ncbi:MAG TPA: phosphoribosylanthranilate isomerase [Solirubrobacteraceae bacterium]|jgi:phosphoribosylanthranilate isomerase|nr:phosphoribosylanthranilate isomerase [Solirubrobacteraceae bacterium]